MILIVIAILQDKLSVLMLTISFTICSKMNQELQEQINLQKENEKWKKLLQSNLFSVCKSMDPDTGLIDCLVSEQVLNKRAAESCQVGAFSSFFEV